MMDRRRASPVHAERRYAGNKKATRRSRFFLIAMLGPDLGKVVLYQLSYSRIGVAHCNG
jgi:hypothetical protein